MISGTVVDFYYRIETGLKIGGMGWGGQKRGGVGGGALRGDIFDPGKTRLLISNLGGGRGPS